MDFLPCFSAVHSACIAGLTLCGLSVGLVHGCWTGCDEPVPGMEQSCATLPENSLQWNSGCDTCSAPVVCPSIMHKWCKTIRGYALKKVLMLPALDFCAFSHLSLDLSASWAFAHTQTCLEFINLSQFLALFLLFPLKELEFLGFHQGITHLFCSAVTI